MIPASYMFKQVYHQHWEAAEPEVALVTQPRGGIVIPLRQIIALAARALDNLRHRGHGNSAHTAG
ncbi:hypothetical protein FF80_02365 [Devosia sp. LC5]|uniref:hypothetical protein n=1 Tax=Devosia sp. LC5 TaxID=1502724 RepID=UPI0004E399B1|nr:hypothetical protein [Devosia sp. LC5]KFC66978.1 hypothetical protein FF80_02365 [Devosia sp. LC5]